MFETQCSTANEAVNALAAAAEAQASDLSKQLSDMTIAASSAQDALTTLQRLTRSPLVTLPRVERDIQARTGWIQPSNAGDTGGSSDKPSGTFLMSAGDPATFSAAGAYAYNNGYWYYKLGAQNEATRFVYRLGCQFPTAADLAASQAVEFELQQCDSGRCWNMAWQAPLLSGGEWRTFDFANHVWVNAGVPLDKALFAPGSWIDIEAEYRRNGDRIEHVALTLNGVRYPVSVSRPGVLRYATTTSSLNVAFQLDSRKVPVPYKMLVRGMEVHWL